MEPSGGNRGQSDVDPVEVLRCWLQTERRSKPRFLASSAARVIGRGFDERLRRIFALLSHPTAKEVKRRPGAASDSFGTAALDGDRLRARADQSAGR